MGWRLCKTMSNKHCNLCKIFVDNRNEKKSLINLFSWTASTHLDMEALQMKILNFKLYFIFENVSHENLTCPLLKDFKVFIESVRVESKSKAAASI